MRKDYCVAGHVFSVVMDEADSLWAEMSQYEPFLLEDGREEEALFVVNVADGGHTEEESSCCLPESDEGGELCYRQGGENGECMIEIHRIADGWHIVSASLASRPVSMKLWANGDFSRAELRIAERGEDLFALNNALMLMYAFRTAGMGTIEMHASVIMNGGKGYLFLAESGTGKSTHSRMWLKNVPGSRLLNDDNPIVRLLDDGTVWVYGSPWSGKTPCYRNESCPVGAMVEIVRADFNKATQKDAVNAFSRVYSSSSGMKFDELLGEKLCDTVCGVVSAVKVFTLECLPEAEAALVCREAVTRD